MDCAVFGLPDDKWGEKVSAVVQLHAGCTADADDLIAFVKARIGSVKAPKQLDIWPDLPRSKVGKVLNKGDPRPDDREPVGALTDSDDRDRGIVNISTTTSAAKTPVSGLPLTIRIRRLPSSPIPTRFVPVFSSQSRSGAPERRRAEPSVNHSGGRNALPLPATLANRWDGARELAVADSVRLCPVFLRLRPATERTRRRAWKIPITPIRGRAFWPSIAVLPLLLGPPSRKSPRFLPGLCACRSRASRFGADSRRAILRRSRFRHSAKDSTRLPRDLESLRGGRRFVPALFTS